jgi:hypothetical protein
VDGEAVGSRTSVMRRAAATASVAVAVREPVRGTCAEEAGDLGHRYVVGGRRDAPDAPVRG